MDKLIFLFSICGELLCTQIVRSDRRFELYICHLSLCVKAPWPFIWTFFPLHELTFINHTCQKSFDQGLYTICEWEGSLHLFLTSHGLLLVILKREVPVQEHSVERWKASFEMWEKGHKMSLWCDKLMRQPASFSRTPVPKPQQVGEQETMEIRPTMLGTFLAKCECECEWYEWVRVSLSPWSHTLICPLLLVFNEGFDLNLNAL